MKYSIIIPIYNASRYISGIVNNILQQKYRDFELLLIDDGSKDDSLSVCQSIAAVDSRVVVVSQENGGPSKARNAGLNNAQGEYVLFADADDEFQENFLEQIDCYVRKTDCDVYCYGYLTVRNDYRGRIDMVPEERIYKNRQEILSSVDRITDSFWFNVVYDKVYKRSLIEGNRLRFDETIYLGEDRKFCLELLKYCSSWHFIPLSLYVYKIQNSESISAKCDLNNYVQGKEVQQLYNKILTMSLLPEDIVLVKSNYEQIRVCISHMMQVFRSDMRHKYSYIKSVYEDNKIADSHVSLDPLSSSEKKLTYRLWVRGNAFFVYIYAWMLFFYKYKAKLYKENEKKYENH